MSQKEKRAARSGYRTFVQLATRWHDNDIYGHVNNVVYYAWFDTAVNQLLIEAGLLDPASSKIIGLVVETSCTYWASLAFPQKLSVGLRADHIGTSSVRYALAIFAEGEEKAAAQGLFTHVYVTRETGKAVPIPDDVRRYLQGMR